MTDEMFGDEGEFGDGFFASLEAAPGDPAADASDDLFADDDAFLYETEEDGSFETDAADDEVFEPEPDFADDFDADPDFDPDL